MSEVPSTAPAATDAVPLRGFVARGRLLGLIGPAFVAAIAFVDPGNIATNISAGVDYKYLLLWAVVAAALMAMVVQYLSAKLGLATGQSLAEVCRERTNTPVRITLWLVAEIVVISTDLAEFVGGAIALQLLFDIPLLPGGIIVAAVSMLVLRMRVKGRELFPIVVVALLVVLAGCFIYLIARSPFNPSAALAGLVPRLDDSASALLACGIIGATVMPHAVFLHSSLAGSFAAERRRGTPLPVLLRYLRRDVLVAMTLAGVVNALMLLIATELPAGTSSELDAVYRAFADNRGTVFAVCFAVAMLASGLASACAGVFAGQAIMQGFLRVRSNIWLRRLISTIPALVVLALVPNTTQALVLSQVVLSFGLPFALIPLLIFTSRRVVMAELVNGPVVKLLGGLITAIVVGLNMFLLVITFAG